MTHRFPKLTPLALLVLAALLVLPAASATAADEWDDTMRDLDRREADIIKIIKERKLEDGVRYLERHYEYMLKYIDRLISIADKRGQRDTVEEYKRYKDYWRRYEDESSGAGGNYLEFLKEWKEFDELCKKFREEGAKNEQKVIDTCKKFNEGMKRHYEKIKDGKEPALPWLQTIRNFKEKGVVAMNKGLEQMEKAAEELFGRSSKRIERMKKYMEKARDGRHGDIPRMKELCKITKESIEKWKNDVEKYVNQMQKLFQNVLEGPKDHREYQEQLKYFENYNKQIVDFLKGDKGFAYEGKALLDAAKKIAEQAEKDESFKQRDIDELSKQLKAIMDVAKEYRFNPPRWVIDSARIMVDLKNRGEQVAKLNDETDDLDKKLAEFNKACDGATNEAVKMLSSGDDWDDFEKAIDKINEMEEKVEEFQEKLDEEFEDVEDLLKELARLPKRRGLGDVIVQAIMKVCAAKVKHLQEVRKELAEDEEVEAMLEGFDGE